MASHWLHRATLAAQVASGVGCVSGCGAVRTCMAVSGIRHSKVILRLRRRKEGLDTMGDAVAPLAQAAPPASGRWGLGGRVVEEVRNAATHRRPYN